MDTPRQPVQRLSVLIAQVHPDTDDHTKVRIEEVSTEQWRKYDQPFGGARGLGRKRPHRGLHR